MRDKPGVGRAIAHRGGSGLFKGSVDKVLDCRAVSRPGRSVGKSEETSDEANPHEVNPTRYDQRVTAHYFSESPGGPFERRRLAVELAGRSVTVSTAGGIFSPDGVDRGTAVLLKHAPDPAPEGHLLDIGCGWGPMALSMALLSPGATVWAVDVNDRSRTLCAENAAALGLENLRVRAPDEVPSGTRFSTIWSNPPIRVGKDVLHELLELWLPRLDHSGQAQLVVAKKLGADSLLTWIRSMLAAVGDDFEADRPLTEKGFRLLRVLRKADAPD